MPSEPPKSADHVALRVYAAHPNSKTILPAQEIERMGCGKLQHHWSLNAFADPPVLTGASVEVGWLGFLSSWALRAIQRHRRDASISQELRIRSYASEAKIAIITAWFRQTTLSRLAHRPLWESDVFGLPNELAPAPTGLFGRGRGFGWPSPPETTCAKSVNLTQKFRLVRPGIIAELQGIMLNMAEMFFRAA
ncbi:hypothetical protein K438DRAFT_1783067 [Mycena galopus ATCC 62051]|nr:hypothetical protein K438DRAFT_1783067 [Mycena galopus ATCC 62051]